MHNKSSHKKQLCKRATPMKIHMAAVLAGTKGKLTIKTKINYEAHL